MKILSLIVYMLSAVCFSIDIGWLMDGRRDVWVWTGLAFSAIAVLLHNMGQAGVMRGAVAGVSLMLLVVVMQKMTRDRKARRSQ